jgi:ABC-type nitrate/sulfonate/bicarbonate transport system substrate-binding protein
MKDATKFGSTDRRTYLKSGAAIASVGLAGCVGGLGGGGTTTLQIAITHPGLWDTAIITNAIPTEQGFFEEEGIETETVNVSAEGGIRALISGDADLSLSSGIMGAYASYRDGVDVRIVANEWSAGSDLVWYSKADSKYETLEDCTDARIGFSQPSSSTHMTALGAVSHAGLDQAELSSVGGPPDANAALESDSIDLAWTVPPFFFDGIRGDKYQQVFVGDQIPPFDDMTLRIHTGLSGWLSNNGDLARSYFRAYQKGLDWAYDNKREAAEIWGNVIDYDNYDILVQALEENYVKQGLQLGRIRNLEASNELAVEHDFIDSELSQEERDEMVDLSYVPE